MSLERAQALTALAQDHCAHLTLCKADKGAFVKGYQKPENAPALEQVLAHKGPVGILPSSIGCVVLDVDKGGQEAVDEVSRMLGTPLVTTPSKTAGRFHIWYLADDGIKDGDWSLAGKAPKNGEIRAGGNLVLWHPDRLVSALNNTETRLLARLAPADVDRIQLGPGKTTPAKGARVVSYYDRAIAYKDQDWSEGNRNNLLNRLVYACGLNNDERVAREVLAWVIAEGYEKDSKARATYHSGWDAGQAARDVALDAAADLSPEGIHTRWLSERGSQWHYLVAGTSAVGTWARWDGARWERLSDGYAFQDAKRLVSHVVRQVAKDAGNKPAAVNRALAPLRRPGFVADVVKFNSVECIDHIEDYDRQRLLLNTPEGVVNLETGDVLAHDLNHKFLRVAGATPKPGECPVWLQCLDDWSGGDAHVVAFLQRLVGYSLRADNEAHAVVFLYGAGSNGKSVFLRVLQALHGDYSQSASHRVFTADKVDDHPTALASLMGARLVAIPEVPPGARFDEEALKRATGGDEVTARFMRQDYFTFVPVFLPLIVGNNEPSTRDVGESMRRRLHVLPFDQVVPPEKRDKGLYTKLQGELSAIMAWAVEGHLQYLEHGLGPPAKVQEATQEYFSDNDRIGQFLERATTTVTEGRVAASALFNSYVDWVRGQEERPESQRRFGQELRRRGFRTQKSSGIWYLGLELREDF